MASDDSEDDFVTFGTALEQLDEEALPRKKPFTLEDQVAKDENGRRRFHGAFTGGFSAGFMNTVGSLEGWKPSEFKSSRSERGALKDQRPQDFMDDEDKGEFGFAPNRLAAKADFADTRNKRRRQVTGFNDGPIPGTPVLHQLLQPARETVGVRLLKKMGWKPGQGIGPRVDAETRRQENRKFYGCAPPPGHETYSSDEDDDIHLKSLTFAPVDIQPYIVEPKKDSFGLGYSGLDRHSVLGSKNISSNFKYTDKNRKVNIRGQAFGVGAFENEDEDIYSNADMSQYDFALGDESVQVTATKTTNAGDLPGFILSSAKVVKKNYPPPQIPVGFKGKHEIRKSRFDPPSPSLQTVAKPTGLGRHDITAQTRGVLINEKSEMPAAIPITDITEESKVSLNIPVPASESNSVSLSSSIPQTTNRFKPFVHDPDKQLRYEKFLALKDKGLLSTLQPVSLSQWEREREKREFEQAAVIFKPLAGVMEDRFTSAQQPDDINPLVPVEKVQHGDDTKRNAAKMKLFGTLTREEFDWTPCSLLCKRFNVPEPGTSFSDQKVVQKKKTKYSIFDSLDALIKQEPIEVSRPVSPSNTIEDDSVFVENVIAVNEKPEEKATNEPLFIDPETKIDLFKAIFLDSSDDEDNDANKITKVTYEEPIKNTVRNSSPPRGIFANVDLDALSSRFSNVPIPIIPAKTSAVTSIPTTTLLAEQTNTVIEDTYGPKLPDKFMVPGAVAGSSTSSDEDQWEEKSKKSSHKHKKHKKQKKSKKQKKKHKK